MLDKKLTDKEIIKALEDEIHLAEYVDSDYCSNVNLEIIKSALDLITRQQAEIESLKIFREYAEKRANDYKTMRDKYLNAKSEAIKDFAERVKKELLLLKKECRKALDNDGVFAIERARKKIDNLVKEMVGENNG